MSSPRLSASALHPITPALREVLRSNTRAYATWESITPLARNEWICWITSAKKAETRTHRLMRTQEDLASGKRRPCCWPGCPHRNL